MLFLAGAMAAGRADDPATTRVFLAEADETAGRLGADANHLWTAFGPTNVTIHRVATAMELGDFQAAIDLSLRIDTSAPPVERRVRHALDVAHAYTARRRTDQALDVLPRAERLAPGPIGRLYVFGGSELAHGDLAAIRLDPSELAEHAFYAVDDATSVLVPRLARRIWVAVRAHRDGLTPYLEHGQEPDHC